MLAWGLGVFNVRRTLGDILWRPIAGIPTQFVDGLTYIGPIGGCINTILRPVTGSYCVRCTAKYGDVRGLMPGSIPKP